jgi:hypothetical protein
LVGRFSRGLKKSLYLGRGGLGAVRMAYTNPGSTST